MKQFLKKIIGPDIWNRMASHYHRIRRILKHAIQKKQDFSRYVYPEIGKHPTKKDVFLVLSPTYRNLGDHAIAKAEMDLLAECGIACREITIDVIQILAKYHDYDVFGRSTVLITGGGYLGNVWPYTNELACKIIENNPKANIIVMPSTVYFDQTPEGERLFEASREIFNLPNVKKIYLRENMSYSKVYDKYANAKLVPDMVMRMNESRPGTKRSGCLICLRNDREMTRSESQTAAVYDSVAQLFGHRVTTTDMQCETDVLLHNRLEKLEQKFDQFRHAELVITDRLHGMIFSAITGTPCIVINSRSHKLMGCYEWIRQLDYVRFCSSPEDICSIYAEIPQKEHIYDAAPLRPWFEEMKQELLSTIKE